MKRFTKKYRNILALTALAAPLLYGCSDELFPDGEGNGSSADKGLVIYVPKVAADAEPAPATRAGGVMDFNGDEGNIESLYLFAYPKDGGERTSINLKEGVTTVADAPEGYDGYRLDLATGTYRLYVAANVDISDFATITEEELKNYHLSIGGERASELPMSCANSQMKVSYNGDASSTNVTDEAGIEITSGASTRVWADLKFAVAKVRVTVLNDLRPDLTGLTSTSLTNLADASALMSGGTVTTELGGGDFSKTGYYQLPEMNEDLLKVDIDNMTALSGTPDGGNWAWQGVAYVAERLFGETVTDKSTVNLTFSDNSTKILEIGTKGEGLKRSYLYDYVGTSNGKFKLAVQPWDPVTIAGALHGPYFLHVDHTRIEKVSGGTPTDIWYESNAQIECVSPKVTIGDDEVDIFSFTVNPEENKISVSVSPQIKQAHKDLITEKYFTIKAGTIEKRIDVENLDLSEFLTVGVENLTIDVREQISSGHYSGSFIIPIRTNLDSFSITDWTAVADNAVTLCNAEGQPLASLDNIPAEGGVYNLLVKFEGLNDGLTFWQNAAQITFKVNPVGASDATVESKTVTVNVLPAVDNYKIHLHVPGWSSPHIYVYQCLELPSTHSKYPNDPLGAKKVYDNTTLKNADAALEYVFTGAAAFKGWGSDEYNTFKSDGSDLESNTTYGFRFFKDGEKCAGGWSVGSSGWEKHYYDYDFCKEYRSTVACGKCGGTTIERGWPGIKMQPEGNDWWVFELSGVATPGKAMIMFTDANSDHKDSHRYPADGDPGIPLFDYPSREGWFDNDSPLKQFTPTKPTGGDEPTPSDRTYRIYWKYNSSSWTGLNFWGSLGTCNDIYTNYPSDQTVGTGTFKKYDNTYAYLEVKSNITSGTFNYEKRNSGGYFDKKENQNLSLFTLDTDGNYSYTIDQGSGKPTGSTPTPGDEYVTYRIQWPYDWSGVKRGSLYISGLPEGTRVNGQAFSNNNYDANDQYGNDRYFRFEVPSADANSFSCTFYIKKSMNDSSDQKGPYTPSPSDFSSVYHEASTDTDIHTYVISSF